MKLDSLAWEEKIGQMFMLGFSGDQPASRIIDVIDGRNIGFCILFARNIKSLPQVIQLTNRLHALAPVSPFIFTDQEGGTVVQFKELTLPVTSPMGLAATGDARNARIAGQMIGEEMNALGIDGVLGPVADVNREINNPIIGIRAFSDDPLTVAAFGNNFFAGLRDHRILACGKHFPGHGDSTADSHAEIPRVNSSWEDLEKVSLVPFRHLIENGIPALLTSHIRFSQISKEIATFSAAINGEILRQRLGFKGVLFSDCLEMKAVKDHYSPEAVIDLGIKAGLDVFTVSHSVDLLEELLDILCFKVRNKEISRQRIDQSFDRIIGMKSTFSELTQRKQRTYNPAKIKSDDNLLKQEKILDQSITVLKDQQKSIPLDKQKSVLVVEWEKVKATLPITQAEPVLMLKEAAKGYLPDSVFHLLKLSRGIPSPLADLLLKFDYVIAGVYSRSPVVERLQAAAVKNILKIRSDLVVVAMGNPYDIRHFPQVKTFLATFGFRDAQLKSLFRVLTGEVKPVGRLPLSFRLE